MIHEIYKITNTDNSKVYIGRTCRGIERRWKEHCSENSCCTYLKHAIAKYGKENFKIETLVIGSKDYIVSLEKDVINLYDSMNPKKGYNLLSGGEKGNSETSEITKQRISESLNKFYENNVSHNLGKESPKRLPVYVDGFWFPCKDKLQEVLGISKTTFYRIKKAGLLHNTCRYFNPIKVEYWEPPSRLGSLSKRGYKNPMYGKRNTVNSRKVSIEGVTYPSISQAVRETYYTKSMLEKRLKKGVEGFFYLT